MMMLRSMAFAAVSALLMTQAASAERASVRRGVSTADLAASVTQMQQTTADMRLELNNASNDIARLNGDIETLQFLLNESREEVDRLQSDDKQIAGLIEDLEKTIAAQDAKIAALEVRVAEAVYGAPGAFDDASVSGAVPAGASRSADAGASVPTTADQNGGPRVLASAGSTGGLGTISAADLPGDAGPLFADAKSKLLQFDYAGAEASFRAFLERFSDDAQAGEAQYWLGEVLYQQEAYGESGAAYADMIKTYPSDPRAPDALVKLARSLRLVGETGKACSALDQLPKRYPEASGVTKNLAAVERSRSGCAT